MPQTTRDAGAQYQSGGGEGRMNVLARSADTPVTDEQRAAKGLGEAVSAAHLRRQQRDAEPQERSEQEPQGDEGGDGPAAAGAIRQGPQLRQGVRGDGGEGEHRRYQHPPGREGRRGRVQSSHDRAQQPDPGEGQLAGGVVVMAGQVHAAE
eukprot:759667-Hanusia_phi.AAC.1